METKMQTDRIYLKKEKLSVNVEQIVENDMSLADYYGDIVKILGSSVAVNVFSASVTGDKAVVDGSVKVRVLYVNNESNAEIFEADCPFNRSVDVRDAADTDCVAVTAVSDQVTCRAVNQRRAEIRGSVSLKISVSGLESCETVSADNTDFCHVLPCRASGSFLTASTSKCYTLSANADVDDGIKAKKIYRINTIPVINEVRTIKNKMMIKGSVTLDTVMLAENGGFVTQKMNIPVNQIADIDGIDEESRCCVKLDVRSTDVRLSADTPQAPAQLEASVTVIADIDAYRQTDLNAVSEAYSPACELLCEQKNIKCVTDIIRINENHTVTTKMDFSSCKATEIADAAVRKIRYTVQPQGNNLVLKGNIHFGLVVISADNEKLFFDRIADFEYTKQFGSDITDCDFQPNICVNAINCSVSESSQAVISTELHIDGFLNTVKSCNVITSIEKGQEKEHRCDDGIITVYFASKGERLWDIAKNHGSSVGLIKSLNELEDDVLGTDRMLVFELE